MTDTPKLIVGLGNYGNEYENTRHNAGWWLLDALAREYGAVDWAMQFPMLETGTLRGMLSGFGNVLVVDNGRPFREEVLRKGYESVFLDNFGGSFGHCTESGNRLLARNAARLLCDRLFGDEN